MSRLRAPVRNMTISPEGIRYLRVLLEDDLEDTELDDEEVRSVESMIKALYTDGLTMLKVSPKKLLFLQELIKDDLAQTELTPRERKVAELLLKKIIGTILAFKRMGDMDE